MYAKVMKKKRESSSDDLTTSPTCALKSFSFESSPSSSSSVPTTSKDPPPSARRKLSLIDSNRASWSSHDSVEALKREPDTMSTVQEQRELRINGEPSNNELIFDHDYEAVVNSMISNANYETLRPLPQSAHTGTASGSRNGVDTLPIYAMPFKHRQVISVENLLNPSLSFPVQIIKNFFFFLYLQVSNASSEDPGYERVRLRKNEDLDTDSEPNYESMPHELIHQPYSSVGGWLSSGSDLDPNYESVSNGDPNYESVKYMSLSRKSTTEPPYEKVSFKNCDDPDYERIQKLEDPSSSNVETDDEQYVQV